MTHCYLSRVRLRRDVPAAALAPILLPGEMGQRAGATHCLLWTLFADQPDRQRDFLWRETGEGGLPGRGAFFILSARPPSDVHGLFEIEPPRAFMPELAPGDRLTFSLRANPVVTRKHPTTGRSGRHDIVMDRLKEVPKPQRSSRRWDIIQDAGREWLAGQGERHGFCLPDSGPLKIDGYDQIEIGRDNPCQRANAIRISVLDFDGVLRVQSPDRFVSALHQGFGKAKAFGCGLMLIRRH